MATQEQLDLRRRWIEALRSGEYKQGVTELKRRRDGELLYCCLGVLCELIGTEFREDPDLDGFYRFEVDGTQYSSSLAPDQCRLIGLYGALGERPYAGSSLAALNDAHVSFAEIADIIEHSPHTVFVD